MCPGRFRRQGCSLSEDAHLMNRLPVPSSLAALLALALSVPALAEEPRQPPAAPAQPAAPQPPADTPSQAAQPQLTPAQQAELEKALQQDAAANARSAGAAPSLPSIPGPVGFALQSLNPDLSFIADV